MPEQDKGATYVLRLLWLGLPARVRAARRSRPRDERGAALILALVFLVVAALSLTALLTFAGTGLLDTAGFTSQRGLQYGANGAVEIAIQRVRYQSDAYTTLKNCLGATTTSSVQLTEYQQTAQYRVYCKGESVPSTIGSRTATVSGKVVTTSSLFAASSTSFVGWGFAVGHGASVSSVVAETVSQHTVTLAQTVTSATLALVPKYGIELFAPYQRLVTFYACRSMTCSVVTTSTVTLMTPNSVLVTAVVGFGDLKATGKDSCTPADATSCGESFVVTQWTVSSANH